MGVKIPAPITPPHDRKAPFVWRRQTTRWQDESRMVAYRQSAPRKVCIRWALLVAGLLGLAVLGCCF